MNAYTRQLTDAEIAANAHREFVGGMWDAMGALQLEFLQRQGLRPEHRLVDVGCGALRGGVQLVRYLHAGSYHGLDINASLIAAGRKELEDAGLLGKNPQLLVDDRFALDRFGVRFDVAFAQSVFTHLPMNSIVRCLREVRGVLGPGGRFYATYFEAPAAGCLEPLTHQPGGVITRYDADPYHYAFAEFEWMASLAGLKAANLGEWNHPRGQKMLAFS